MLSPFLPSPALSLLSHSSMSSLLSLSSPKLTPFPSKTRRPIHLPHLPKPPFKPYSQLSPSIPITNPNPNPNPIPSSDKFDWFSYWYPLSPICDLDKRAPHAKRVLGLDVVIWWDRVQGQWQVFDDRCPHRLAPLSEGRIDQWGRLQCVYHGWCFDGNGGCNYIPQADPDRPPDEPRRLHQGFGRARKYPAAYHPNRLEGANEREQRLLSSLLERHFTKASCL